MTLLTLATPIALKLLTRVPAVDGRRRKSCGWSRRPRLASVARRHGIFQPAPFRLAKYRERLLGDIGFVPAMIVPEQSENGTGTGCRRIEIAIANGRPVACDLDSP